MKSQIPAVIVAYNQLTFVKNMVQQLEPFVEKIIVVDNKSTYQPLLDYYANDFKHTLVKREVNFGSARFVHDCPVIKELVGDVFFLSDPDILFNPKLPKTFVEDFLEISHHFQSYRVGFALNIFDDDIRTDILLASKYSIKEWESQFWKRRRRVVYKDYELYFAKIDTTFCLINRAYRHKGVSIRVAGDCTAIHMPWHRRFMNNISKDEFDAYVIGNTSTDWFKE
jgi:hypothetical protein